MNPQVIEIAIMIPVKITTHSNENGEVDVVENHLKNILDDESIKFERNNNFGTWKELFADVIDEQYPHIKENFRARYGKKEMPQKLANFIFLTFIKHVMEDMIFEHDTYSFPYHNFATMAIGRRMFRSELGEKPDLKLFGEVFFPEIRQSERTLFRMNGVKYHIKFTSRWRKRFQEAINKGQRYK